MATTVVGQTIGFRGLPLQFAALIRAGSLRLSVGIGGLQPLFLSAETTRPDSLEKSIRTADALKVTDSR